MSEADKKPAIVEAAFQVLMKRGVQALSFKEIAEEAGLSRQLLRYYFDDFEDLTLALCDHLAGFYRTLLVSGVAKLDQSKRLDFFLDFYFDLLDDPRKPRDDQAYDAVFALAAGSKKAREALKVQYGLLGHVVSHEIQLQYPELSADESLELSYLFVCLMYGHWKMVASLGYSDDHKYITRRAIDRLIRSYTTRDLEPMRPIKPWVMAQ